jgi:hypothetical protein
VAERAVEVVVRIGTAPALGALVRAFVALVPGPEQVVDAIAAGIVLVAGKLSPRGRDVEDHAGPDGGTIRVTAQ